MIDSKVDFYVFVDEGNRNDLLISVNSLLIIDYIINLKWVVIYYSNDLNLINGREWEEHKEQ